MKKFYTLLTTLLFAVNVAVQADKTFEFCYSDGTIIPSDAVITVTETEEPYGMLMLNSGIFVKNTTEYEENVKLVVEVTAVPESASNMVQCCFPSNCRILNEVGTVNCGVGAINAGAIRSLMTEIMIMDADAPAIFSGKFTISDEWGASKSTITLNMEYKGTAHVSDLTTDAKQPKAIYTLAGQRCPSLSGMPKGVYIIDGKKVIK